MSPKMISAVATTAAEATPSRRRLYRRVWGGLLALAVLVALAPRLIAITPLRNALINAAIEGDTVQVSTDEASFGYFTPVSVGGLRVIATDGSANVHVRSITAEKSWLRLLLGRHDLGTFTFVAPKLDVVATPPPPDDPSESADHESARSLQLPQLSAAIEDAAVTLRTVGLVEPVLDLRELAMTMHIRDAEQGSVFVVEPVTLLEQEPLSPALCNHGLQLIAPMLANEIDVRGALSFRLDHCSIPVGDIDRETRARLAEIDGEIEFQGVSVGLKNEITKQLLGLVAGLRGREPPGLMTVAETSTVRFQVIDGRVHHQGLTFLLPYAGASFGIDSSGSVGIDETLDLTLALDLPAEWLGDSLLARFVTAEPLELRVRGTVDEPIVGVGSASRLTSRLQTLLNRSKLPANDESSADVSAEDGSGDVTDSVLGIVGDLLEQLPDAEGRLLPGLQDRLRERRESAPRQRLRRRSEN